MKIAFLAPFGLRPKGTVQARMLPLATELQLRGHSVEIIAPPYTNPEDSGKTETVNGVTVRNIVIKSGSAAIAAPFAAKRMLSAALVSRPDLIHLFKPKGFGGLSAMALLAAGCSGIKMPSLVVDCDDREGTGGMNNLHKYGFSEKLLFSFQEKLLVRFADGVTVASRVLESLAWATGALPERTLYLPNGAVLRRAGERLRGRKRFGIDNDTPLLLLYTRFFEFDQQRLYKILELLFYRIPKARLLVVGDGRHGEAESLKAAFAGSLYHENIIIAGWLEPEELPDCIAAADAAVYLFDDTLINRTKCPAKLAELAAAGIPVAAESVGQICEYLRHGESGLLSDSGDQPAFVENIVRLLTDREYAGQMGFAAVKRMNTVFSWATAAERLELLYKSVIYRKNNE